MIGQKQIQAKLREQISNNTLAKFIMLVGDRGSGKKTLAKWLAKEMGAEVTYILPDVRVETIRQMIDDVYASTEKMVCIIPDTDGMNMPPDRIAPVQSSGVLCSHHGRIPAGQAMPEDWL